MVPQLVMTSLLVAGWIAPPERIDNPHAAPASETARPSEAWRVGGESEDPDQLFGVIVDLAVDDRGYVYALDLQLAEVAVFDRDGRFVRRVGRAGEGPGELMRPRSLCVLDDGRLCVMQPVPAQMSAFDTEGAYAGKLPVAPEVAAGFQYLVKVRSRAGNFVCESLTVTSGEGYMDQTTRISSIAGGETQRTYARATRRIEFAKPVVRESETNTLQWTVGPAGRVYVQAGFDYEIRVFDRSGTVERVIGRDYEHRERSRAEREAMRDYFVRGAGTQGSTIEIMPYDRDIQWFAVADDGRLWVLGSGGAADLPPDTIGVFDIYAEGRLVTELSLVGEGEPMRDRYFLAGRRMYVVTRYADAFRVWQTRTAAGESEAAEEEEAPEPMGIICYDLPAGVLR